MSPLLGIMASQISGHLIPPSSFYNIATVTVSSGTSVSFTSIPSGYSSLQIRFAFSTASNSGASPYYQFNLDSGSNYNTHYLEGTGSAASAGSNSGTGIYFSSLSVGNSLTSPNVGIIDIADYANTSKYKTARNFSGSNANGSTAEGVWLGSGLWRNTAAITSITFTNGSAFTSGTTFALYGVN
jgi:hypothetical protein